MNIEAVKAKLEQLNQKGGFKTDPRSWRPKKGENIIRIAPLKGEDLPFKEVYWHWNIGNNKAICPRLTYGEECPICDYISFLWDSKSESNITTAKKIRGKLRAYAPVVDRAADELSVKWWGIGVKNYKSLIAVCAREDLYGDISDAKSGRDLIVTFTPAKSKDEYPETDVMVHPQQSPLAQGAAEIKRILASIPNFEEYMAPKSFEDIEKMLNKWASPDEGVESGEAGDDHLTGEAADATEGVEESGVEDLDAMLENLNG